ncbi:hypothetical protein JXA56_05025 [Candidatus Micrarchaeota archaeon]|nr:hypothetical protein [Candidatus Micrarchaeota archaeon]
MKIKLTPELSYIIGLWRKNRTSEGVGVRGDEPVVSVFTREILDKQLSSSDRMLSDDNKVYFYHSAYRKFFQQIEKEQLERFRYLNEYAASYLAGMFDATGQIDEKGIVFLKKFTPEDEIMLLRLGFGARKRGPKLIIERPAIFLTFIKNYVKIYKDHKVFDYIKS